MYKSSVTPGTVVIGGHHISRAVTGGVGAGGVSATMWSPASMQPPPPMTDLISCSSAAAAAAAAGGYVQRSPYPPPPSPMTGSQHHHGMPGYAAHAAQGCYPTSAGYYGNGMDYLSTMQFAAKPANAGCGALSSYCAMGMNVPGHVTAGHIAGHVASQMGYGGLDGSGYLTRGAMTPSSPECMDTKEWGKFHPI